MISSYCYTCRTDNLTDFRPSLCENVLCRKEMKAMIEVVEEYKTTLKNATQTESQIELLEKSKELMDAIDRSHESIKLNCAEFRHKRVLPSLNIREGLI